MQVLERCRASGRALICGGQVLALRSLLKEWGWSVVKLAHHSGVSRQMIGATLQLQKFPTTDPWSRMARAFGLELHELDLLAFFEVRALTPL